MNGVLSALAMFVVLVIVSAVMMLVAIGATMRADLVRWVRQEIAWWQFNRDERRYGHLRRTLDRLPTEDDPARRSVSTEEAGS